jgi:hypothetical protein
MLQTGRDSDFSKEPFWPQGRRQFGVKDLQCHRTVVPQVMGEKDCGHATTPKLALDVVPIGQSCPEAIDGSVGQFGESEKDSTRLASGFGRNQ